VVNPEMRPQARVSLSKARLPYYNRPGSTSVSSHPTKDSQDRLSPFFKRRSKYIDIYCSTNRGQIVEGVLYASPDVLDINPNKE
jgi:hypothetical protein